MNRKGRRFFYGVLILLMTGVSVISCTPHYISPEITYTPLRELKKNQPNCTTQIETALANGVSSDTLEAFRCYHKTIQYYQDEYEVVESQLEILYREELND